MCISDGCFYSSGYGDRLVDPSKYPKEIVNYLKAEEKLLLSFSSQFDLLVEIGCMDGRYLDWAVGQDKRYLGIDIVDRYVKMGRNKLLSRGSPLTRCRIEICDATVVHELPFRNGWLTVQDRALIVFPFNSFGNMKKPDEVLGSVSKTQKPFLICSYLVDDLANKVRLQYYNNCGYGQIKCLTDDRGVRFVSDDGLDTIAYYPAYLEQLCEENRVFVEMVPISSIGVGYHGITRRD